MTKYNPDIHHRRSIRFKGYDYSRCGLYFITICVQNRECLFGEILIDNLDAGNLDAINRAPTMTVIAQTVEKIWDILPTQFPNVITHEFIVMPNHIHGILEIHGRGDDLSRPNNDDEKKGGFAGEKNPMFHENLSRIVRWFKGRTTFECRKINPYFAWQRNYHEHIIRNEQSYQTISEYIVNNPTKWANDRFNPKK